MGYDLWGKQTNFTEQTVSQNSVQAATWTNLRAYRASNNAFSDRGTDCYPHLYWELDSWMEHVDYKNVVLTIFVAFTISVFMVYVMAMHQKKTKKRNKKRKYTFRSKHNSHKCIRVFVKARRCGKERKAVPRNIGRRLKIRKRRQQHLLYRTLLTKHMVRKAHIRPQQRHYDWGTFRIGGRKNCSKLSWIGGAGGAATTRRKQQQN